jgi:hypothetical protein
MIRVRDVRRALVSQVVDQGFALSVIWVITSFRLLENQAERLEREISETFKMFDCNKI